MKTQSATTANCEAVAKAFCAILREWLTESEFADMVKKNGTPDYPLHGACPSHDYCDANEAMDEAFKAVFGHLASDTGGVGIGVCAEWCDVIWEKAWTLARQANYKLNS